jgi:hypothetical protein
MRNALHQPAGRQSRVAVAYAEAREIADEDVALCRAIGEHGLGVIIEMRCTKEAGGQAHGQYPDPLQCRLARHRRLGHGAGADLSGA